MKAKPIAAAILGLSVTAAFAAPHFEKDDTNDDGLISQSEFMAGHEARMAERFARLDTNADGFISEDEMEAAPRGPHEKRGKRGHKKDRSPEKALERLDADSSGGVSQLELADSRLSPDNTAFAAADTDSSGELDATELKALMKAHKAERRKAKRADYD